MNNIKHFNDHTKFIGTSIVAIHIESGELHLFDQKIYEFVTGIFNISIFSKAGYEILGFL